MGLNKHSVLYHSLLLTSSSVLLQLLGFLYRIIVGRMAGPQVVAVHGLVMSAYNVVLSCTLTGIALSVSRIAAQYQALGSGRSIRRLISTALALFVALFTALAIPFGLGRAFFAQRVLGNPDAAPALLLLVPCLFLTGFENVHKAYFYGTKRNLPPMVSEITEMMLRILSALVLFGLARQLPTAQAAAVIVMGMICSEVVSATFLTTVYRVQRRRLTGRDDIPVRRILRDIASVAAPISCATLLSRLLSAANVILIPRTLTLSGMSSQQAMEQFGAVSGMTMPLLMVPAAFLYPMITVLTPRFSAGAALQNRGDIRRKAAKAIHVTGLIGIPAAALLLCMGKPLAVQLYGNALAGDHLLPLTAATLLGFYYAICESILEGIGLQKRCSVLSVTVSLLGVCSTVLVGGVLRRGMAGFLCGELVCSLCGAVACGAWVLRSTGLRLRWYNWFGIPALSAVVSILAVRPLFYQLLGRGILPGLAIAFCTALFLLLYCVCLRVQGTNFFAYLESCRG